MKNHRYVAIISCLLACSFGCKPRKSRSSAKDLEGLAQGRAEAPFVTTVLPFDALNMGVSHIVSIDDSKLALLSFSGEVALFETAKRSLGQRLKLGLRTDEVLTQVAFGRDVLVAGTSAGRVFYMRWSGGKLSPVIQASDKLHTGAVSGLAVSSDGELVASGGVDAKVHVTELASGRDVASISQPVHSATTDVHAVAVTALAFTSDDQIVIARGQDLELASSWRSAKLDQKVLHKSDRVISALILMEDPLENCGGKSLLPFKTVAFVGNASGRVVGVEIPRMPGKVVQVSADKCTAAKASNSISDISANFAKLNKNLTESTNAKSSQKASSNTPAVDFQWLKTMGAAGGTKLEAHQGSILNLAISRDGSKLITVGVEPSNEYYSIGVWDLTNQKIVRMLNYKKYGTIAAAAVQRTDGKDEVIFTSTSGTELKAFGVTESFKASKLDAGMQPLQMASSPDGMKLVAVSEKGAVKGWSFSEAESGQAPLSNSLASSVVLGELDLKLTSKPIALAVSGVGSVFLNRSQSIAVYSCQDGISILPVTFEGGATRKKSKIPCEASRPTLLEWAKDGTYLYLLQIEGTVGHLEVWSQFEDGADPVLTKDISAADFGSGFGLGVLRSFFESKGVNDYDALLPGKWIAISSKSGLDTLIRSPWTTGKSASLVGYFGAKLEAGKVSVSNLPGADPSKASSTDSVGDLSLVLTANGQFLVTWNSKGEAIVVRRTDDLTQTMSLPMAGAGKISNVQAITAGPNDNLVTLSQDGIGLWWLNPIVE